MREEGVSEDKSGQSKFRFWLNEKGLESLRNQFSENELLDLFEHYMAEKLKTEIPASARPKLKDTPERRFENEILELMDEFLRPDPLGNFKKMTALIERWKGDRNSSQWTKIKNLPFVNNKPDKKTYLKSLLSRAVYECHFNIIGKNNSVHQVPLEYFRGFRKGEAVIVLEPSDVIGFRNPYFDMFRNNQGAIPFSEDAKHYDGFMQDVIRSSLNIVVEIDGKLKKLSRLPGIEQTNGINPEEYILDFYEVYRLEKCQISKEIFMEASKAYFQALMYFIKSFIQEALTRGYYASGEGITCNLVFYQDGRVFLDQFQEECVFKVLTQKGEQVGIPSQARIVTRIPFSLEKQAFLTPTIFANEHALPFVRSKEEIFLGIRSAKLKLEGGSALDAALKAKSKGAKKVAPKPSGKKKKKTVVGIVAIAGFTVGAVVAGTICPPLIPAILGAAGVAATNAAVMGATTAVVAGTAVVVSAAGAGAATGVLTVIDKIPGTLPQFKLDLPPRSQQIMLEELEEDDFEVVAGLLGPSAQEDESRPLLSEMSSGAVINEVRGQAQIVEVLNQRLEEAEPNLPLRRTISCDALLQGGLFRPMNDDKGKEEAQNSRVRSFSLGAGD